MAGACVYILKCADGSYYVGLDARSYWRSELAEHNAGTFGGYTSTRRPVTLEFAEHFEAITDAIAAERKIKGMVAGEEGSADVEAIGNAGQHVGSADLRPSFETPAFGALLRMRSVKRRGLPRSLR